jgi:DNA-binding SARP family transcriptional activator
MCLIEEEAGGVPTMGQWGTVGVMSGEPWNWPIQICLLGRFRVLRHGQVIAIRSGGKVESFLYQLSVSGQEGVSREVLLDSLWPETDIGLAGRCLNSLVYSVRQLFGEAIGGAPPAVQRDGWYQLNADAGVAVDVAQFEELIDQGQRSARRGELECAMQLRRRAINLYRGDLHGDSTIHAIVQRERLRATYLSALAQLAGHYYEAADYRACLDLALKLLDHDPCREDAHRLVMRCHVRRGERAQALRQFRVCSTVLRADFDGVPEMATRELYDRIRFDPAAV